MLTDILFLFMQRGLAAIDFVMPYAYGLFGIMLTIDFVWASIQNVLNQGNDIIRMLAEKTVKYGLYALFITNYPNIIQQILQSFVTVGLAAGGGGISSSQATDPSYIIDLGYNLMDKIYSFRDIVQNSEGNTQSIVNTIVAAAKGELTVAKLFPNFFFWLVSLLVLLAFTIIAIQLFVTWIETYFIIGLALIFLPFGVQNKTAFLAEKAIGAIIGAGVKLMMLLFVVSVAFPILNEWTVTANPSTYDSVKLLTTAAAIAFLCWQAPSMAASLMTGTPSLTAGSMMGGVAAAVAMTGAAVSATRLSLEAVGNIAKSLGSAAGGVAGGAGAALGIEATMAAANAATADAGGVTSAMLNTSGDSLISSYDGTPSSSPSSGKPAGFASQMDAAQIAARVQQPSAGTGQGTGASDLQNPAPGSSPADAQNLPSKTQSEQPESIQGPATAAGALYRTPANAATQGSVQETVGGSAAEPAGPAQAEMTDTQREPGALDSAKPSGQANTSTTSGNAGSAAFMTAESIAARTAPPETAGEPVTGTAPSDPAGTGRTEEKPAGMTVDSIIQKTKTK